MAEDLNILIAAKLNLLKSEENIKNQIKQLESKIKGLHLDVNLNSKDLNEAIQAISKLESKFSSQLKVTNSELDKRTKYIKVAADGTKIETKEITEQTNALGQQIRLIKERDKETGKLILTQENEITNYKKLRQEQEKLEAQQSKYWSGRVKETMETMTRKPDELIKMADYYKELEVEGQKYNQTLLKQDAINERNAIKSAKLSAEVFKAEFDKQEAYKKTSAELQKLQQSANTTNTVLKNFGSMEQHKKANELTASLQKLNITQNMTQKEMQETISQAKMLSFQLTNVSREARAVGNHSMTMGTMLKTAAEKFSV